MPASFEYKPRFKDMRIKPPRPGEEEAKADVLRLKPGEKPCQWPDCTKAATARAPKSRERLNDFYDFCQPHAGEYNKSWNFYAGMSESQIRAAKENEAMTGGRPTWEMKAGKNSREAAAFAAKMGTANTAGAGSWRDSFGLFGRKGDQAQQNSDRRPARRQDRTRGLCRSRPRARCFEREDQGRLSRPAQALPSGPQPGRPGCRGQIGAGHQGLENPEEGRHRLTSRLSRRGMTAQSDCAPD